MQQISLDSSAIANNSGADAARDDHTHEIAPDVAYQRLAIANVAFVGLPHHGEWVLIDAGVIGTKTLILKAIKARFGPNSKPTAIVLTHGHFDHVGALSDFADEWNVPIYAHQLEIPYLNGSAAYPPPDPGVGGGLMALLSPLYPRGPVDVRQYLHILPPDGSVPPLPGWEWIHTPGHSPGHVSLWRESDRFLIAGDAFITTTQESAYAVATQKPEMHGPPMYFTQDFEAARESVRKLAALEPELVITGHGQALRGPQMRQSLHNLAQNFDEIAVPDHGRYVSNPAHAGSSDAYDSVE